MIVYPMELDKAAVTCLFAESCARPRPPGRQILSRRLRPISRSWWNSIPRISRSTLAAALAALADGKPETIDTALDRLLKLVNETPLDDLSTGARPNSRQRAEAYQQMGVWLVARPAWKRDSARSIGDQLASRAYMAARRQSDGNQSDPRHAPRTRPDRVSDRGDKASAEKTWTEMLESVLANPLTQKTAKA